MWETVYARTFLKDYERLPVGDYRIGLRLDFKRRLIEFRRVLYRSFP